MSRRAKDAVSTLLFAVGLVLTSLLVVGRAMPAGISFTVVQSPVRASASGLAFYVGATEAARLTASGMTLARLALSGDMSSALPTDAGGIKHYMAWDGAARKAIEVATLSGMPSSDDLMFSGIGGAASQWTCYNEIVAGNYHSTNRTTAAYFTNGLATAAGTGILVGGVAASVPTTNALDIANATLLAPAANVGRLQRTTFGWYIQGNTSSFDTVNAGSFGATTVRAASIQNQTGTGAPTFTYGLYLPMMLTKPTAPAANTIALYAGSDAGVAVLSVEKSAGTTHIVTIVP